ncbi:PAS domain S-box-containing protein [Litoreibacter ponti]|uniref:histidine kinase n=1 Tax=Litoreibacter ponti TaxID=1510457 RepID=A0A2T6BFG2_9RHOB|nr:PAS domain-containing hybrid sensor histidine kinase/response regulator [Litoreibacter ponti]PTX54798.1 PAS domain S-box-containing protein [Litoreibacter ponti]
MAKTDDNYLKAELDRLIAEDKSVFQFLRNSSLDGVWYWDLQDPENEWMSPEFWRLFGIDPETKEHKTHEWQNLIHPDDLALALENFERHSADPDHPYDQIVRYKHVDGNYVWVRCRGMAIRDENGTPIRMLGAHNDLTELMRTQEKLDGANARLTTVLDTVTAGIIGVSPDKQVLEINIAGRHMLGAISDETPFPWPEEIVFLEPEHLNTVDESADPVNRALAGEVLVGEVCQMSRKSSESDRYVKVSSRPIEDTLSPIKTVLVIDDISDLEQNRQQIERASRLDALGQLTGGIAHDFNNLLATIHYALQLSLTPEVPERPKRYLETALSAVKRGSTLTNRLLAFAKRQPGLAASRALKEVFNEFDELIRPTIEETIELRIQVPETKDLQVYCDLHQLENAMLNLVLNSRDALMRGDTSDREHKIIISARPVDELEVDTMRRSNKQGNYITPGMIEDHASDFARSDNKAYRYVQISVTDNGPGMSDEIKRRAIDPFFTTKRNNSGTGLGLSMVYGFVQQSDGELRIYSEEGHGTTVSLLLPRGTTENTREAPMDRLPLATGGGRRVLVVEDEPALLEMIKEMLVLLEYNVLTARSGREALKLAQDGEEFDLLLTDIVMPGGVGGFDLAKAMRKERPDLAIVYMSGYTGFTRSEMGNVEAPMVQKPCPPKNLTEAFETAFSLVAKSK